MSDPIRDELHRLSEEFKKLLAEPDDMYSLGKTTPEQLTKFGLTLNEAESWIKHEPNFLSDASYHEPENRRKVTRTRQHDWSICGLLGESGDSCCTGWTYFALKGFARTPLSLAGNFWTPNSRIQRLRMHGSS
jgi:hypothetical protein